MSATSRKLPSTITVKWDRMEQETIPFPSVFPWFTHNGLYLAPHIFTVKLEKFNGSPTGADYVLAGFEQRAAVERKKNLDELCKNLLSDDYMRSDSSFKRLVANTAAPYICIEETATSLLDYQWKPTKRPPPGTPSRQVPAGAAYSAFYRMVRRLGITPVFLGRPIDRKKSGAAILHLLLSHTPYCDDLL